MSFSAVREIIISAEREHPLRKAFWDFSKLSQMCKWSSKVIEDVMIKYVLG